eukprot:CAMPEP_0114111776 /NCGR_PEP_ID=MMETSP0043_2-20121206/2031_1 /TAXON_ID=464988 /ORGANISM="Hemiselmis andersenii, Strain CCMP644" /LENGTH=77 /DNA_ID=CAMNT_0001203825 /DNA_START=236 /DNA_END=469 /DNA_ORIENTATION=-
MAEGAARTARRLGVGHLLQPSRGPAAPQVHAVGLAFPPLPRRPALERQADGRLPRAKQKIPKVSCLQADHVLAVDLQ